MRGGATLDMTWQGGHLQQVKLQANLTATPADALATSRARAADTHLPQRRFVLSYGSTQVEALLGPGEAITFDGQLYEL